MTTGSMFNHLMGNTISQTPEVGMGATILMWTDRHAATVVNVAANGKQVTVREDHARRTDDNGMSDAQSYEYEPDPHGREARYSLRGNGAWVRVGSPAKTGERLLIGVRRAYHDYSF